MDRWIARLVTGALALGFIGCIVGVIVLAALGHDVPDLLREALVGTLAALTGSLVDFRPTNPPPAA